MLSLFICEDNLKHRERIETAALSYIADKAYDMKLALSTGSPTKLLDYLEQHPGIPGVYILDIDLQHEIDGIVLASKIRAHDAYGAIVFVTTHAELSYLTFQHKVEAMDYIVKDDTQNQSKRVQECIELAYQRYLDGDSPQKRRYQVRIGTQTHYVPFDEIIFFESHATTPGKLILRAKSDRFEFYDSLNEVSEISPEFFRCHKSYVVNLRNIKRIDTRKMEVEMVNGSIVFVAVKKATELEKRMAEWLK